MTIIGNILVYCEKVKNDRNIIDVYDHAFSEMSELDTEVDRVINNISPGEDGIVGEAVDVILCMVDLIHQYDPWMTEEQISEIVQKKLDKWYSLYHNKEI